MKFIVIMKQDNGKYIQARREGFIGIEDAQHYCNTTDPGREPIVVDIRPRKEKLWTKDQIENFLRQETLMSDDQCKKTASLLFKKDILNTAMFSINEDYTHGIE